MASVGTAGAVTVLKEHLMRHPSDRDTLQAHISFSRDAGNLAVALEYAEQLARVAPNDPSLTLSTISDVKLGCTKTASRYRRRTNSSVVSVGSVTDTRQPHHRQAFSASRPLPALVRGDFVSEVILIMRLPVRPSRLKAISMPTVLRNVWQRRSRPAKARGFLGHPAVLSGTSSPAAIGARRRSEALPAHVLRTAMISRTKAATGSASMMPSIAARRLAS
jgi:hypothetical protein